MSNTGDNPTQSELILYQTEDLQTQIEVRLTGETVWLSLNQLAELFQRDKSVISRHLSNIFQEGELTRESVVANYATTAADGKSYEVDFYNLDVIISVGYRVRSLRGTQFRIWATGRLREYLVKGFAMDDRRLKEQGGGKYFEELLARIRDIRSSEKIFWNKILDIYATSADYDPKADTSQTFFATVQNKMHWAAHGHTAAEVLTERADSKQPNMGMTTWMGERPRKADATIAKNYLQKEEIEALNLIVSLYLDFAELQALNRRSMTMAAWIAKLDDFLRLTEREVLTHAGSISGEEGRQKAETEYEKFRQQEANKPSAVERHFEEAIAKTKQIDGETKQKPKGKP